MSPLVIWSARILILRYNAPFKVYKPLRYGLYFEHEFVYVFQLCVKMLQFSLQLRQGLDGLTNQLKELPARLRQYASYEYVKRLLQSYSKVKMEKAVLTPVLY